MEAGRWKYLSILDIMAGCKFSVELLLLLRPLNRLERRLLLLVVHDIAINRRVFHILDCGGTCKKRGDGVQRGRETGDGQIETNRCFFFICFIFVIMMDE